MGYTLQTCTLSLLKTSARLPRQWGRMRCYTKTKQVPLLSFPNDSDARKSAHNSRRPGFNPWIRMNPRRRDRLPTPILLPGKSHGQRSHWWAAVHWVAKSWTRLSDFTFTFHSHALEKETATHSSVLPGESQGWGSLVGCRLWGHTESDTTEAT